MPTQPDLKTVYDQLKTKKRAFARKKKDTSYRVPVWWTLDYIHNIDKKVSSTDTGNKPLETIIRTDFFDYHLSSIEYLLSLQDKSSEPRIDKENLSSSSCYNMFMRYATAYTHSEKKESSELFSNDGTILKSISLLPLLSVMGFNHIHLLPVTTIGRHNRKGSLGSPFAVRNPFMIESSLCEPILEITPEDMFSIFVDTCHRLGISVSAEFILRTASIDSDMALENPEWFYWISSKVKDRRPDSNSDSQYGRPNFAKKVLREINDKVGKGDFKNIPQPREQYRKLFTSTPGKVARVEDRIVGFLDKKNTARIPHAFSDWPPDDNQPIWSDCTYYKIFDHPEYNYIAYNTIRMYDDELISSESQNTELWDHLTSVIPYWIEKFRLDGALIDMAHALPKQLIIEIKNKARQASDRFFLMGEFFNDSELTGQYFDGIVGNMCLSNNDVKLFKQSYYNVLCDNKSLIILSGENHNTRRIATHSDKNYALFITVINSLLPGIYFILNGSEVGETSPMNMGLGFEETETQMLNPNEMALFSSKAISWDSDFNMINTIRNMNAVRSEIFKAGIPEYSDIQIIDDHLSFTIRKHDKPLQVYCNFGNNDWHIKNTDREIRYKLNVDHDSQDLVLKSFGVIIIE